MKKEVDILHLNHGLPHQLHIMYRNLSFGLVTKGRACEGANQE
jgi:hypothetical protein